MVRDEDMGDGDVAPPVEIWREMRHLLERYDGRFQIYVTDE